MPCPAGNASRKTFDFLNQSFEKTTDNETKETSIIVTKNIEQSKNILNQKYDEAYSLDTMNLNKKNSLNRFELDFLFNLVI